MRGTPGTTDSQFKQIKWDTFFVGVFPTQPIEVFLETRFWGPACFLLPGKPAIEVGRRSGIPSDTGHYSGPLRVSLGPEVDIEILASASSPRGFLEAP